MPFCRESQPGDPENRLPSKLDTGRLNVIADKLSRMGETIHIEWSLPPFFQPICSLWQQPQVQQQTATLCLNSKRPPLPWAVDALNLPWEDLDPYAFGTVAILKGEKLQDYPYNRIIRIAPGWSNMPWFWDLVAKLSQLPLCVPNLPNLLTQ